jgi:hypothetical protein
MCEGVCLIAAYLPAAFMTLTVREKAGLFLRKSDNCVRVKTPLTNPGYVMLVKAGAVRYDFLTRILVSQAAEC